MNVQSPLGTDGFSREVRKIEIEVQDSINETMDRYRQMEKTHLLEALGGVEVPRVFSVMEFYLALTGLLQVIGPGGALASLSISTTDYLKEKYDIGREPVDFLILIGKSSRP